MIWTIILSTMLCISLNDNVLWKYPTEEFLIRFLTWDMNGNLISAFRRRRNALRTVLPGIIYSIAQRNAIECSIVPMELDEVI